MTAWPAAALALLALAAALWLPAGGGPGPAFDDAGGDGHATLAATLARAGPVSAVEGSLALLPADAGDGDVLFLFPSHRAPQAGEADRVRRFAEDGGRVVVAADGQASAGWLAALGLPAPAAIPLVQAPGEAVGCLELALPSWPGQRACLPSPTSFPNPGPAAGRQGGEANALVFLDLDADGTLSLGDQGPFNLTVGLQGTPEGLDVVAVADGDLWRNAEVATHPGNLDLAVALANAGPAPGTTYLDSTAAADQPWAYAAAVRALASPSTGQLAAFGLVVLAVAAAAVRMPRARAWTPHRHDPEAEDPELERAIAQALHRPHGHGPSHSRSHGRPAAGSLSPDPSAPTDRS